MDKTKGMVFMTNKEKKNLSKYRKKVLKNLFLRWILPLYLAWQCGYNMSDNQYLNKYSHQSECMRRLVLANKESLDDQRDFSMFSYKLYIQYLNKYIEMRDYAYKLENKLKAKSK